MKLPAATVTVALLATACGGELSLPEGDPAAGREAFVELRCTACHRAFRQEGFPDPIAEPPV